MIGALGKHSKMQRVIKIKHLIATVHWTKTNNKNEENYLLTDREGHRLRLQINSVTRDGQGFPVATVESGVSAVYVYACAGIGEGIQCLSTFSTSTWWDDRWWARNKQTSVGIR